MTIHLTRTAALAGALLIAACASVDSENALRARTELIGMPTAQLLSCAGVPDRSRTVDNVEYFTYENERFESAGGASVGVFGGSGHVGGGVRLPLGAQISSDYCEATFTLRNGVVTELVYNTARGGGRYAVCGRIVEGCLAAVAPPAGQ